MGATVVDLILGFLGVNAVLAVAASLAVLVSWHVAIAATVLLALGLCVASVLTRRFSLAWAALIAFPAGVIGSMELDDYAALRRSEVRHVSSPREARADGSSFVFDRAAVKTALHAEYRHVSRPRGSTTTTTTYFYAAPLADETWSTAEPVPAWAICRDERCLAGWSGPCPAAMVLPTRHADEYRQAVAAALSRHALRSAPDAPALACVASPESAREAQLEAFRFAVQFWNGAWLSGWLGYGIFRLVRRRPETVVTLSLLLLAGRAADAAPEIPRGVVVDRVVCLSDPAESYALYLPAGTAWTGTRPVICASDPAARGRMAVERFRRAAEAHGYVVVGSNNARNGPAQPALRSMLAMIQDARQRFAIDPQRVVLAGFSGGARLVTQLARVKPLPVAAVVAVGAGLSGDVSPRDLPPAFFLGVVGRRDFNYREMVDLLPRLRTDGVDHGLIETDNRHAWPSEEDCVRAVEWLELRAMAAQQRPRDQELIETAYRAESARARALADAGDLTGAVRAWEQVTSLFGGLREGTEGDAQARALRAGDGFRRQAKQEERLRDREAFWLAASRRTLSELASAPTPDLDPAGAARDLDVPRLLSDLRKPNAVESSLAYRLLSVVEIEARSSGWQLLDRGDASRAAAFFRLGVAATAHEPARQADLLVALACAHAAGRFDGPALASLREAVGKGFTDPAPLREQRCFEALRAKPAFAEILAALEARPPE